MEKWARWLSIRHCARAVRSSIACSTRSEIRGRQIGECEQIDAFQQAGALAAVANCMIVNGLREEGKTALEKQSSKMSRFIGGSSLV
jgi:hypothetical protein